MWGTGANSGIGHQARYGHGRNYSYVLDEKYIDRIWEDGPTHVNVLYTSHPIIPWLLFFSSTLFSIIFMLLHRKTWDSLSTRKRLGGRPEWLLNPIIAHRDERDQRNRALVRVTLDARASSWHDQTHAGGISQVHPTGKSRNHDRWPCKTTTTMMIQSHTITYTEHPGRDAHVDWSWGCKFTTTRNTRIRIDIDLIGWGLKRET